RLQTLPRRRDAEEKRAHRSRAESEQQDSSVQLGCNDHRQIGGNLKGPEEADSAVGESHSECASDKGEKEAFRHQLSKQPRPAHAQRETYRDLARARTGPAEHQVGDIGASNEEHYSREHRHHRNDEGGWWLPSNALLQFGSNRDSLISVRVRIHLLQALPDRRQLALSLLPRHTRLEPTLDHELPPPTIFDRIATTFSPSRRREDAHALGHHDRNVEGGPKVHVQAREALRRDADHGEINAVDHDAAPAQDRTVLPQRVLPKVVSEDDDRTTTRHLGLVLCKGAPHCWLDTQDIEEVIADQHSQAHLANVLPRLCKTARRQLLPNQSVERTAPLPQVAVIGVRQAAAEQSGILRAGRGHRDDRAGIAHRQRAEEERVVKAEKGAVGANAQ